jgi:hypothetical protein
MAKRYKALVAQGWPDKELIAALVDKAGVLFVYAATLVRFIGAKGHNPRERLQMLLEHRDIMAESPYQVVDGLYIHVLRKAVNMEKGDVIDSESMLCKRLRLISGTLVLLFDRLTSKDLTRLLGEDEVTMEIMLQGLKAVLVVDESDIRPIHIFHQSFRDFLIDPLRCTEPCFRVEPNQIHRHLARRCLVLMNERLKYNICSIQDPTLSNTDTVDSARVDAYIPAELQYACMHWLTHLTLVSFGDKDLSTTLQTFCENHLLHWLEVLSLIQKLELGLTGLPPAQAWCKVRLFYTIYYKILLMALSSYI